MTFVGYGGISVRRQGVQGLHVHVGMPSAEDCWRCLDAILPWLSVVLALSANSPWFAGELTGMASNRAPILAELPRGGAPPAFASYAEWEAWVERLVAARRDGGLHAHLVGRSPASEARNARGARPRPADRRRALGRVRGAYPGAVCDGARRRLAGRLLGDRARRLRAEPMGGGTLRAAREPDPSGRLVVPDSDRARAELLERVRPAAERLGGAEVMARIDPRGARQSGSSSTPVRVKPLRSSSADH